MSKNKKIILIIGGIILVIILCLIIALVVVQLTGVLDLLGFLGFSKASGPMYMPSDTWLYASLNMTIQDQAGFKHLKEVYEDVDEIEGSFDDFEEMLDDEYDIKFEDDIKPWIGSEIAFGLIDEIDINSYYTPRFALVVQTRNNKRAQDFIEKLVDELKDDFEIDEDDYQDIEYQYFDAGYPEESFGIGIIKGFLVLGYGEDAFEDIVDVRMKDEESLEEDDAFQEIFDQLPKSSAAKIVYDLDKMDIPAYSLLSEMFYSNIQSGLGLDALETMRIGFALDLNDDGIKLEYVSSVDPDELSSTMQDYLDKNPSPQHILESIPEDALAFISGHDLGGVWKAAVNTADEVSSDLAYQLEDFTDVYGISVNEDFLDWASGEYALVVVEANALDGELPVGGYFIQEVSDPDDAEDVMDDLIDLVSLSMYMDLDFDDVDFGKTEIQMTGNDFVGEDIFGYGMTDNDQLIIGVTEEAFEAALENDGRTVEKNQYFQEVKKQLPGKNMGYIFINVESSIRQAYLAMDDYDREDFDEEVQPFLRPIKALGAATSGLDPKTGINQGTLFIYIP